MDRIVCSPALYPFQRSAKIFEDLAIDGFDFAVRGHDRNETGYPVNCRTGTRLALPQCFFGLLPFIDVDSQPVPLDDVSLSIAQRLGTRFVPTKLAVCPTDAVRNLEGGSGQNCLRNSLYSLWNVVRVLELLPATALEILKLLTVIVQMTLIEMSRFEVGVR